MADANHNAPVGRIRPGFERDRNSRAKMEDELLPHIYFANTRRAA